MKHQSFIRLVRPGQRLDSAMFSRGALLLICTTCAILVRLVDGRTLAAANALGRSGCSGVFAYKTRASDAYTYGLISVSEPPGLGGTMDLVVLMSLDGRVSKSFDGRLELFYNRPTTIQHIRARRPIWYVVHFPVQSPLPQIKEIVFNQRVLCKALPEFVGGVGANKFVTEIRLHHVLYTGLASQIHTRPMDEGPTLDDDDDDDVHAGGQPLPSMPTTESPVAPLDAKRIVDSKSRPKPPTVECGRADERFSQSPLHFGGLTIQRGSWPWIAAIYTVKPTGMAFMCAGNLVTKNLVVTAAHCVRSDTRQLAVSEVLIALGRHDMVNWMETGSRLEEVADIVVHPDYRKTSTSFDADIAVARLRRPIEYSEYIRPICLWRGSNDLAGVVGTIGTVVGWGSDGHGQTVTKTPRSINIPIVSEGDCLRSSATFGIITSNRSFCAGRKDGFGPCHGDSGSGLAVLRDGRMMLRGIVSAALAGPMSTCDLSNYVLFTDASKFVEWIESFQ